MITAVILSADILTAGSIVRALYLFPSVQQISTLEQLESMGSYSFLFLDLDSVTSIEFQKYAEDKKNMPTVGTILFAHAASAELLLPFYRFGRCDFITKPARPDEILARVQIMESVQSKSALFEFQNRLDDLELTLTEQRILSAFFSSSDSSASRDEIMKRVWPNTFTKANVLDVHIFNLRKKLTEKGLKIVALGKAGRWQLIHQVK